MGVPFLFQAIAERYPCLMANITANQVILIDFFFKKKKTFYWEKNWMN